MTRHIQVMRPGQIAALSLFTILLSGSASAGVIFGHPNEPPSAFHWLLRHLVELVRLMLAPDGVLWTLIRLHYPGS